MRSEHEKTYKGTKWAARRGGRPDFIQASVCAALTLIVWAGPSAAASEPTGSATTFSVSVDLLDDWGSGACGEGVVTNNGSVSSAWEVSVALPGSVTSYWNSKISDPTHSSGDGSAMSHAWRVVGEGWNRMLEPNASTTFGFCLDRTQAPEMPAAVDLELAVDDTPAGMPMEDPDADMHMGDSHTDTASEFIDLATFGLTYGSDHTDHTGLVGGRTAITTEALLAYNHLRAFAGLAPATLDEVGVWAFANNLTNNTQAWGTDQMGVGLWYAMQGAKVGWMADDGFDPQVIADIERTARLGVLEDVMAMVVAYGHEGFAEYLTENGHAEAFINTLKMEPHYGGWMHDRAHGWLSIEGVAIAHDLNHLTVLSHDQMQPFMNDTWDWPQWPALEVSQARVLEYFQSMVVLGDPLGNHLGDISPPLSDDADMLVENLNVDMPVPETDPDTAIPIAPSEGATEPPGSATTFSVSVDLLDDWGSGACGEGVVTNNGSVSSAWEVSVALPGSVTSYWNSKISDPTHSSGDGSAMSHAWRVVGEGWNRMLEPNASTTFGFCLDRTQAPEMPAAVDLELAVDDTPAGMPMEDPDADMHMGDSHTDTASEFIDLATFGLTYGSDHTDHTGLVGGRTAITTEALLAYNHLRAFAGLAPATLDEVGVWAFANNLTNNTQAWGTDQMGVGLWYAMQGAKVGWMADDGFDPQVIADIERTARLGVLEDVMAMVVAYGHEGFAEYLTENGHAEAFINTLKMEPHYGGWMHDRAHGWLSIEGVAIAHDLNHLTVLSHDQMQPFMNDTWDWPQWPALEVSQARVLEYFQSMVVLGDPLGNHLGDISPPSF